MATAVDHTPAASSDKAGPRDAFRQSRFDLPHLLLMAVAVLYCVAGFVRIPHSMAFSWDEAVYASQFANGVPPMYFAAARAWGSSLLVAPVAVFTPSIVAIRIYLTFMSAICLYLAYRPWLRVTGRGERWAAYVAPGAAALFVTLWTTLLYGTMSYPNLWLAFALVAGIGYLLHALAEPSARRPLIGVVVAFAAASLLRPTDALAAAGALLATVVLVRAWRRLMPAAAVAVGLGVGWTAWVVEAFVRFGDPLERLRTGAEVNAGGLTLGLRRHLEAVDGPYLLCRPHALCAGYEPEAVVWWLALPILAVLGIMAARRSGILQYYIVAVAAALSVAAPYLLFFGEAHPRYLLPVYGLLAVPAAQAFVWAVQAFQSRARIATVMAVCAILAVHALVQQQTLDRVFVTQLKNTNATTEQARVLRERMGIQPPCLLYGQGAIQLSYPTRCRAQYASAPPQERDTRILAALAGGERVVVLLTGDKGPPGAMANWEKVRLPNHPAYFAYISPGG